MANSASALKNIRKNRKNYARNRSVASKLKSLEKSFLSTLATKDKSAAETAAKVFLSALEKATKSNLVHSNKVSRKKSRCALLLKDL